MDRDDLSLLTRAYGSDNVIYDLNGDGRVDFQDTFIFMDRYPSPPELPDSTITPGLPDTTDLAPPDTTDSPALPDTTDLAPPDSTDLAPPDTTDSPAPPDIDMDLFPSPPDDPLDDPGASVPPGLTTAPTDPDDEVDLPPPSYVYWSSRNTETFVFADYVIIIEKGDPFGITSLRLRGQQTDFVPDREPAVLADWEWFRIDVDGEQEWLKLITPGWNQPDIDPGDEVVRVRFAREDAIAPGITLEVEYELDTSHPQFDVHYSIFNGSDEMLIQPYAMLGFPGFPNYGSIVEVGTALETRTPRWPHDNFKDEAQEVGLSEYLLLRQPYQLGTDLEASIVVSERDRRFELKSSYAPANAYRSLLSVHTNKPDYLTSHLYATFYNQPPAQRRTITVHYELFER